MVVVTCPIAGCQFQVDGQLAVEDLLKIHGEEHSIGMAFSFELDLYMTYNIHVCVVRM